MGVCNLDASAIAAYGRWKGRQTGRQAGGRAGRELCNCPALGMWPLNSSIYIYISTALTIGQLLQLLGRGQAVQVQAVLRVLLRSKLAHLRGAREERWERSGVNVGASQK